MSKDKHSNSNAKKFAVGAALAAAAGYVVGTLTAPKSGKDMRQEVKDTAAKGVAEAEAQLQNVQDELKELLDDATDRGDKMNKKAKGELEDLSSKAGDAKDKMTDIIHALRKGKADSKELQKAINDAKTAVKHLRKYLSK